jgi:hypothetical protein
VSPKISARLIQDPTQHSKDLFKLTGTFIDDLGTLVGVQQRMVESIVQFEKQRKHNADTEAKNRDFPAIIDINANKLEISERLAESWKDRYSGLCKSFRAQYPDFSLERGSASNKNELERKDEGTRLRDNMNQNNREINSLWAEIRKMRTEHEKAMQEKDNEVSTTKAELLELKNKLRESDDARPQQENISEQEVKELNASLRRVQTTVFSIEQLQQKARHELELFETNQVKQATDIELLKFQEEEHSKHMSAFQAFVSKTIGVSPPKLLDLPVDQISIKENLLESAICSEGEVDQATENPSRTDSDQASLYTRLVSIDKRLKGLEEQLVQVNAEPASLTDKQLHDVDATTPGFKESIDYLDDFIKKTKDEMVKEIAMLSTRLDGLPQSTVSTAVGSNTVSLPRDIQGQDLIITLQQTQQSQSVKLQNQRSELDGITKAFGNQIDRLVKHLNRTETSLQQLINEKHSKFNDDNEARLGSWAGVVEKRHNDLLVRIEKTTVQKSDLADLRASIDSLRQSDTDLTEELKTIKGRSSLNEDAENSNKDIPALLKRVTWVDEQINKINTQLGELKNDIQGVCTAVREISSPSGVVPAMQNNIKALNLSTRDLNSRMDNLSTEGLAAQINNYRASHDDVVIATIQEDLKRLHATMDRIETSRRKHMSPRSLEGGSSVQQGSANGINDRQSSTNYVSANVQNPQQQLPVQAYQNGNPYATPHPYNLMRQQHGFSPPTSGAYAQQIGLARQIISPVQQQNISPIGGANIQHAPRP